jgi:glycosyltransferase involved in cell wall biosynthesis
MSTPTDVSQNAEWLVSYARRNEISVIWLGYGNISYPLLVAIKALAPELKVVVDTDSVWSRFLLRELPFCSEIDRQKTIEREGRTKMYEEEQSVVLADVTTAVSEIDARYYRSIAESPERVHIFSNAIDLASYATPPTRAPGVSSPYVYVAGSFYAPNAPMTEATLWMVNHIWPIIKHEVPEATLVILGNGADKYLKSNRTDVLVQGYVDSVLPYLCHASVAAVPLRFESGTRFKILEAAACKIPIVSTTLGAEGIPAVAGRDILVGDTAEAFAVGCISILRNPARAKELSHNAFELISRHYTVPALAQEAQSILAYLAESSKTGVADSPSYQQKGRTTCVMEAPVSRIRSALVAFQSGNYDETVLTELASDPDGVIREISTYAPECIEGIIRTLSELSVGYSRRVQ